MLKYKLDSIDGLDDGVKEMYSKQGDGYVLAIDGLPQSDDTAGLKAKVDQLLTEKKSEKEKREKAEADSRTAAEDRARKDGDIEALEKSWSDKFAAREAELSGEISAMKGAVDSMTVDSVAVRLATELALPGSADLLIPHIKSRLASDTRDGQYVTIVKDSDGRPSALTIDDLKTEFTNNAAFAPVLIGSKASGGGANGSTSGGATQKSITPSQFDNMSHTERHAHFKEGGTLTDE